MHIICSDVEDTENEKEDIKERETQQNEVRPIKRDKTEGQVIKNKEGNLRMKSL